MGSSFNIGKGTQRGYELGCCGPLMRCIGLAVFGLMLQVSSLPAQDGANRQPLEFNALPDLPDAIGVAGPIVGVDQDRLIVAGGANFASPENPRLWELPKIYHDRVWVMEVDRGGDSPTYSWRTTKTPLRLSEKIGYASVVSTKHGILVLGGEDANGLTARAYLLKVRERQTGARIRSY